MGGVFTVRLYSSVDNHGRLRAERGCADRDYCASIWRGALYGGAVVLCIERAHGSVLSY